MRILGIDPGTGRMGFGVIDSLSPGKQVLIDAGVITTPAHTELSIRLVDIYDSLKAVIEETKPTHMSIEKLFFSQNITTGISVAHARGVAMLIGAQMGLQIFEYTPLQIKQALTGYGRATKSQMQEMVKVLLALKAIPKPDDAADALAAAICHATTFR
jgi:crossover junction endodeoxyribonuclease RuvC